LKQSCALITQPAVGLESQVGSLSVQVTTGVVPVAPATRHSAKQSVLADPPPRSAGPVVVLVVPPPPLVVVEVVEPPPCGVVDVVVKPAQPPSVPTLPPLFVGLGVASANELSNAEPPERVRLCEPLFGLLETAAPAPGPERSRVRAVGHAVDVVAGEGRVPAARRGREHPGCAPADHPAVAEDARILVRHDEVGRDAGGRL
jgi:hypothetical protein